MFEDIFYLNNTPYSGRMELLKKISNKSSIEFKFNAVGVSKESVDIQLYDTNLVIKCESIFYGKLNSTIRLNSKSINFSKITAELIDGVLTINLPYYKEAEKISKKITVK